ncbi:MAG TPA: YHS domain-containing (seleno)protein [Blastocatellia bacterium]|nr:YHS domain-containing (seleno)protein [Blastocatellia bacterium]
MKTKNLVLIAMILLSAFILAGCGSNGTPSDRGSEKVDPINKESGDLALKGYDAVAYFNDGQAVMGSQQFHHEYGGAKWLFASAANRDRFASDPQKFAPQYGGYCSWAVGHGYTAPGDPEAWKILDGKLYLNYNQDVKKKWEQDSAKLITEGDKNWPGLIKQ